MWHTRRNCDAFVDFQYDTPPQGYGAMFMPRKALDRTIEKLRADTQGVHGTGYHNYLYSKEPYARPLVDFWFDPSADRVQRVSDDVATLGRDILDAFVNGQGVMDFRFHYWHGGLRMSSMATWVDQLLASDSDIKAHVGNWAHLWHPSTEQAQFRAANNAE